MKLLILYFRKSQEVLAMKIKAIMYRNFKYVTNEKEMKINLQEAESLVLGGPNGYGKTTIFDALELLITGKIKHFNSKLPNKGEESIAVLANDRNHDIYIAAEFVLDEDIFLIERKFIQKNNFDSSLTKNSESINDDELFSLLGISPNLFDLGIYISQLDSLNFLQQKYKNRKASITGILDSEKIENRLLEFKEIQEQIKKRFAQEEQEDTITLAKINDEKTNTEATLKKLQLSQEDIPYVKLFKEKDYDFDRQFFGMEDTYEVMVSPVNDLIEFSKYRSSFIVKKRNTEINEMVSIDKKVYTALFFKNEISVCIENKRIIELANDFLKLKDSCQKKEFHLNDNVITEFKLQTENIQQINDLITEKSSIEKGMTNTQTALSKILKQRSEFLHSYQATKEQGILPDKLCPLCGRKSDELEKLFFETEKVLKEDLGLIAIRLSDVVKKLTELFNTMVINNIDNYLESNQEIIKKNNLLLPFLNISTSEMSQKLSREKIVFTNTDNDIDFNLFEEQYLMITQHLSAHKKLETEIISDELYTKLERISLEYYSDIKPYDEQVLTKKKFYISSLFSNSLNLKLKDVEKKHSIFSEKMKAKKFRYDSIYDSISSITQKYNQAKKQYQSSIVENIAIPMFIFTGKIIQNYPLGLGVLIQVEDNAVVFKTQDMDSDIFNNLSTGQLNGVVISLLLSIKEIFTTSKSLNTLLIDDPLQTIDDISAISLIDLLSEHFGETQIVLSTHEDDKQYLLKKKYEQSGKRCQVLNMQEEYLRQ